MVIERVEVLFLMRYPTLHKSVHVSKYSRYGVFRGCNLFSFLNAQIVNISSVQFISLKLTLNKKLKDLIK